MITHLGKGICFRVNDPPSKGVGSITADFRDPYIIHNAPRVTK